MPPPAPRLRPRRLLAHPSVVVSASRRLPCVSTVQHTGLHTTVTTTTTTTGAAAAAAVRIKHQYPHRHLDFEFRRSSWGPQTPPSNGAYISTTTPAPARLSRGQVKGQRSLPALLVRSGTSNGLVLRASDLPASREGWAEMLPAAMGSPDPAHGRQLDGVGGGISSTSKICVLAPSGRDDADVDFTFVQVGVRDGRLDTAGNCGNMSAVVGPIAWDWGYVPEAERAGRVRSLGFSEGAGGEKGEREGEEEEYREALVRVFNTNTSKLMHARFRVRGDPPLYCPAGDYSMDGVPGRQSRITLSFVGPAGAKTGAALPTGNPVDVLELPDGNGNVCASLVDVSNPGVFVALEDLGFAHASPERLTPAYVEADEELKRRLEMIRRAGAERMGLDPDVESVPKIVLLFPRSAEVGDGNGNGNEDGVDIRCLAMSMGQAHKAVPLTLALCLGAAANMEGTVAARIRRRRRAGGDSDGDGDSASSSSVVIGHPSGMVEIGAVFKDGQIVSADLHRTARVLMKGEVYY